MFDFTTETIINSANQYAVVAAGADAGVEAGKQALWIKMRNKFTALGTKDTIQDNLVFKRAATPAVLAQSRITIPATTVGSLYRVGVYVETPGYQDGMFARNSVTYGKPFFIELLAKATATANAQAIVDAWNKVYGSYNDFITATPSGAVLIFTADTNAFITLKNITFESLDAITGIPTDLGVVVTATTVGKPSFGDYLYLVKNNRLLTIDNYRPFGLGQEELPTAGASYNQYTFKYVAKRSALGQSAVGGSAESITTHVFWVRADLVGTPDPDGAGAGLGTAWEGALGVLGLTIQTV